MNLYQAGVRGGIRVPPPLSTGLKIGDWICTCGEHVFASKSSCRMCGAQKPMPALPTTKPPDWYCSCGYQNFSTRVACHKCLLPRPENPSSSNSNNNNVNTSINSNSSSSGNGYQSQYQPPNRDEVRPGDWLCSCGFNNFSNRIDCYKCKSPKPMQQSPSQDHQQ